MKTTKVGTSTVKKPPNAGKGRPKGSKNKTTSVLKDAVLLAAELSGTDGMGRDGLVGYLWRQSSENPVAFMTLLGKVLPMQVTGEDGGPVGITVLTGVTRP